MKQNPLENEHDLRQKLATYDVDVPDFPMKPGKWMRFIHFLARPAKDPLEPLIAKSKGTLGLKVFPILGGLILMHCQLAIAPI